MLIHGRWGYRRVSWLICYYFYKNIVLVFTELWFAVENGYSGQIYFPDLLPTAYNAVWTSWQCLFAYIFEQDANDQYTFIYPVIYRVGQQAKYFNLRVFWRWIILSVWHGAVVYFGCTFGLEGPIDDSGKTFTHWFRSVVAFTCIIHVIMYKMYLETIHWNTVSLGTGFFCLALYYGSVILLNLPGLGSIF
jgi:magnesium-transporting ATPase (P-type)